MVGPINSSDPLSMSEDCWVVAQETIEKVVNCVHPTLDSDEKRKDVIDYVQRLIRTSLGCEVFPYGSVPLKTYLPDGDIDLTAISSLNIDESLAHDVLAVLRAEERNEDAEYAVKDTQFIDAEVKLVKCLVQNIVIDISFNQLGGLCTLCFLEEVDRLVGKNHLFKRSIILIKAWCYYESRILGAHHGLISTYALETLVLYIFHLFHSTLNGPLAFLYRFLDYFSKFDWENYCISVNGPVLKSSLPDIVVELPENGKDILMLSEDFLKNCMDLYSVPSRDLDTRRSFPQKHLNIIDPLKENNNLGRSVHRGNFYRICSAFKYGACRLGKILLLPKERIPDELNKFFANTLERHGYKYGTDIRSSAMTFCAKWSSSLSSSSLAETQSEDEIQLKSLNDNFDDDNSVIEHKCTSVLRSELYKYLTGLDSLQAVSESVSSTEGNDASGYCPTGKANEFATASYPSFRSENGSSDCSPRSSNYNGSLSGLSCDAPHFYFSRSSRENGYPQNGNVNHKRPSDFVDEKMGFGSCLEQGENNLVANYTFFSCANNHEGLSSSGSAISSLDAKSFESLSLDLREMELAGIAVDMETLNPLADLSGDHDNHIRSLLYGQTCHGYALSAAIPPTPPSLSSQLKNGGTLDTAQRSMPLKQNSCSQTSTDGVVFGSHIFPTNNSSLFNATFGSNQNYRARGTGTYFPIMNCFSCKERSSQWKRRNRESGTPHGQLQRHTRNNGLAWSNGVAPSLSKTKSFEEGRCEILRNRGTATHGQLHRHTRNNGVACSNDMAPSLRKTKSFEEGSRELSHSRSSVQGHGNHKYRESNANSTHTNGLSKLPSSIEFGSLGPLAARSSQLASGTSYAWDSKPSPVAPEIQTSKPEFTEEQERVVEQSYHLKNEDFPPLSF